MLWYSAIILEWHLLCPTLYHQHFYSICIISPWVLSSTIPLARLIRILEPCSSLMSINTNLPTLWCPSKTPVEVERLSPILRKTNGVVYLTILFSSVSFKKDKCVTYVTLVSYIDVQDMTTSWFFRCTSLTIFIVWFCGSPISVDIWLERNGLLIT